MILQALNDYYHRKAADPSSGIAPEGWEVKEIPYVIVIDQDGSFLRIESTEEGEGKKKRARAFLVPQSVTRSSGIKANLLWDNAEYALGINNASAKFKAFVDKILGLDSEQLENSDVKSLIKFLFNSPLEDIEASGVDKATWGEIISKNPNLAYRVENSNLPLVSDCLPKALKKSSSENAKICLITGEKSEIARLHPKINGGLVRGTNTAGAALISFNAPAYLSYGKDQNYNAPVGESAAFAYTTALNLLASKDSPNKFTLGEGATLLFWSKKQAESQELNLEENFSWFFSDAPKDDPDRNVRSIKALFQAVKSGSLPQSADDQFYVLGLAPNAARISVRFFREGKIRDFATKIYQHFEDIEIVRSPQDKEYLHLGNLLRATVLEYKLDNVPPNLTGDVFQCVLDGTRYPIQLLQGCICRIRAEQLVGRTRAAICKAYLNRQIRTSIHRSSEKEITVSLDPSNESIGYVLGRLFAVLERCQEQAQGNLNASIRERYYGAFSSTPITVLPMLLKLNKHHLAKLNPGQKVWFDKLMGAVMGMINVDQIPSHLRLEEQAKFAVGYYHQRQDFFTKTTESTEK